MSDFVCDRNKSELTHKVTAAAASWLNAAGFKPVETEVQVSGGWAADLAGAIIPTMTECIGLKLIKPRPRAPRYANVYDHEAHRRWSAEKLSPWEAELAAIPDPLTAIVEVKTSRSDFAGDHKWAKPCPANLCWLAMPSKAFGIEELPEAWGILQFSEAGTMRMTRPARLSQVSVESQLQIVLAIATRRDHSTRYERMRQFRAMETARRNDQIGRSRLADVMRGVLSVVRGEHGSIDKALEYHGVRKVPGYLRTELESLWGRVDYRP